MQQSHMELEAQPKERNKKGEKILTLISEGKLEEISAKSSMISSKCLPTTPRHKLTKVGGFGFSKDSTATMSSTS